MAQIILKKVGVMRVSVIKLIKDTLNKSLVDSKLIMDSAPVILKDKIHNYEVQRIADSFEAVGAEVEMILDDLCYSDCPPPRSLDEDDKTEIKTLVDNHMNDCWESFEGEITEEVLREWFGQLAENSYITGKRSMPGPACG